MMDNKEDGYIVLITVLVLGAITTIIVGFLLLTGKNSSIASTSVVANANAKAGATACSELALSAIAANTSSPSPPTASQTVNAAVGETCNYTITGSTPNYTITTVGTVTQGPKLYIHRMTITTNQVSPTVNVSSWQDTP